MESLLRWGIENTPTATPGEIRTDATPRKDLDPGVIDVILGRPDSQVMKECLEVAQDRDKSESARVDALDEFEMLIEQIDNANNIEAMQMWKSIQDLLDAPDSTPTIITNVLWIIGTALQNNPKAQLAYMRIAPLPSLISHLSSSAPTIRSKALYALSGLLKHNAQAVSQLTDPMWNTLHQLAITDPTISIRRKTLFLLNALLIPTLTVSQEGRKDPVHPNSHASHIADPGSVDTSQVSASALERCGIVGDIVRTLVNVNGGEEDEEWGECAVKLIYTYCVECRLPILGEDGKRLREYLDSAKSNNSVGLEEKELRELMDASRRS